MSGGDDEDDEGNVVAFPGAAAPDDAVAADATDELVAAVEALLFASGEPARLEALADALEVDPAFVRAALLALQRRLRSDRRGVHLVRVAKGWQLRTDARFAGPILRLRGARPLRLSRPALEVLAVVAYRQPITKGELDALRGVDSGGVLRTLTDLGVVRVAGRKDEPGRPLVYATTPRFLELFSLPDLAALPTLDERGEVAEERQVGLFDRARTVAGSIFVDQGEE